MNWIVICLWKVSQWLFIYLFSQVLIPFASTTLKYNGIVLLELSHSCLDTTRSRHFVLDLAYKMVAVKIHILFFLESFNSYLIHNYMFVYMIYLQSHYLTLYTVENKISIVPKMLYLTKYITFTCNRSEFTSIMLIHLFSPVLKAMPCRWNSSCISLRSCISRFSHRCIGTVV